MFNRLKNLITRGTFTVLVPKKKHNKWGWRLARMVKIVPLLLLPLLAWCVQVEQPTPADVLLMEEKISQAQSGAKEAQKKIDNCVTITKDAEKAISEYHAQAQASRKWLEAYWYSGQVQTSSFQPQPIGIQPLPETFFARCFNEQWEETNLSGLVKSDYTYHNDCTLASINGNCYRINAHPEYGDCAVKDNLEWLENFLSQ